MKRHLLVASMILVALAAAGTTCLADSGFEPQGYIRSDLQLISQESKDTWSPAWTGPIQAATILAWFYDQGYTRLLRDLNGDGVIDELDTIELADIFGTGVMQTDSTRGTNDARLVYGIAQYVADLYPNEFVLKIYDTGFPAEFSAEGYGGFDPFVIPGVEIVVIEEPSLAAYKYELETAEGVIVGLDEGDETNTYLNGRSYYYETTPAGYTPVDLAWSEENRVLPGHQGKVLETVAMMDERFYIDYRFGWTPVEFMLALSPAEEPAFQSTEYSCAEDALAYHVTTEELAEFGSIQVEECVIRQGSYDTYYWIVTNIDFEWMGCGLCYFGIMNSGNVSVAHSGPPFWTFTETGMIWYWMAPTGSCGIQPGQTAVFSVTVPGPTVDVWVPAAVMACSPIIPVGPREAPPLFFFRHTAPGEPGDCPDLAVEWRDDGCYYNRDTGMYHLTVWATVRNVGTAPVTSSFDVRLTSPDQPGSHTLTYTVPPNFPPGGTWDVELTFAFPPADPLCPVGYRVVVDPLPAPNGVIVECNESNNVLAGTVDCDCDSGEYGGCCYPDGSCVNTTETDCLAAGGTFYGIGSDCATITCDTPTEGVCPDLIIEVDEDSWTCVAEYDPRQRLTYTFTVSAVVTNIGTGPSSVGCSTRLTVTSPAWKQDTAAVPPLASGATWPVSYEFEFSSSEYSCPVNCTFTVDTLNQVIECTDGGESNNTDEASTCCL